MPIREAFIIRFLLEWNRAFWFSQSVLVEFFPECAWARREREREREWEANPAWGIRGRDRFLSWSVSPSAKRVRASRGECSRYRSYLHKAIVFPLLRTRLPRTWRGCHSALGASLHGLQSHQPRIRRFSLSTTSSSFRSLRLSCFLSFFATLRPSRCSARPRSFDFKPPYSRRRPYTLSSLPCLHSCIQLHGAALMHFVRNVRSPVRTPGKRNSSCYFRFLSRVRCSVECTVDRSDLVIS